jgi:hypothetical protein
MALFLFEIVLQGYPCLQLITSPKFGCYRVEVSEQHTCIPSGKFIEESIKTASWLKFISNLQRLGAILRKKINIVIDIGQKINTLFARCGTSR